MGNPELTPTHKEVSFMKSLETHPNYGFTEDGKVFNLAYDRQLKPYISNTTGYLYVTLKHKDSKYRPTALHRILAKLYINNPTGLPQVNHKDGDKLNCHVDNLEWTDNRGNIQHAYDSGLIPKGEHRYNNVNPVEKIHNVCHLLEEGLYGNKEIGELLGVCPKTVGQIKYRKQWKDIGRLYNW